MNHRQLLPLVFSVFFTGCDSERPGRHSPQIDATSQPNPEAGKQKDSASASDKTSSHLDPETLKLKLEAANKGDAAAQCAVGKHFLFGGPDESPDHVKAVKWLIKAADQENPSAQESLAFCYSTGQGVEKDLAAAFDLYHKAAEQGDARAQLALGIGHFFGEGAPEDYSEAVKWFYKAADQGHATAQLFLGLCYYGGRGVQKDGAEAVKWYLKAADQGDCFAQFKVGECYDNGQGVPEDDIEAVKWYRKAAEQGDSGAQLSLGICYSRGDGVPEDLVEAYSWMNISSAAGNVNARNEKEILKKRMSKDQITEAQSLSRKLSSSMNAGK